MVTTRHILSAPAVFVFLLSTLVSFLETYDGEIRPDDGRIIMDISGYPLVFELNEGESQTITRSHLGKTVTRTIRIVSIKHYHEPNLWFSRQSERENYITAEIEVNISGTSATLTQRPYESPMTINGLRVYVESTKDWAQKAEYATMEDMVKDVRISVCLEGEGWGPEDLKFPVLDYRWRSSAYNNTWSSLVPYNKLYYHRGEDYGAIPDKLDIIAPFDGEIINTPLPDGDGASNAISIQNEHGIICRISHMNIETIDPRYTKGTFVKGGAILAKTGMTWDGRKSQHNDPHVHINFNYQNSTISSFPYLMEAYFRAYADPILSIAGGYQFALVGDEVRLDGNRSLSNGRDAIESYSWKLHDGTLINGATAKVSYGTPGLYTEELIVTSKHGSIDRDFVQVRVYDTCRDGRNIGLGWMYYYPTRGIKCSTPVLFWNRMIRTTSPVIIDFGDGNQEEMGSETYHSYDQAGNYVVTLSSTGPNAEPLVVKMEVVVEE